MKQPQRWLCVGCECGDPSTPWDGGTPLCWLGLTPLCHCTDVFTENPDEKSIITYVVAFYHYFSEMKKLEVKGRRLGKVRMVMSWDGMAWHGTGECRDAPCSPLAVP